jgi:hypothetical protein
VELAHQLRIDSRLETLLPAHAVAAQCTLFDKSPKKNWLVALHQDLNIPVKCRAWTVPSIQDGARSKGRSIRSLLLAYLSSWSRCGFM